MVFEKVLVAKDPVQLAFVDGECSVEEESDIYATKLGGNPVRHHFSLLKII